MKGFSKAKMFWLMMTVLLLFPNTSFSQVPNDVLNLGILTSFEGFTGKGAVENGQGSTWSGDAGSNTGVISGFGAGSSFTGNTYNNDAATVQCRLDLLRLYIHLYDLFVDYPATHLPSFTNETISPGVYFSPGAGSIDGTLTLDGGGDSDAFFVIKCTGAMTVGARTMIVLTNGTQSCNVFFIANGNITVGAFANVKGTLMTKLGAIGLGANAVLEGRMFSMEGAITTGAGVTAGTPPGTASIRIFSESNCSPAAAVDVLGVLSDYAVYSGEGAVSNTMTSGISGNIATDDETPTGYGESIVIGSIGAVNSKAQAKIDVDNAYTSLMALPGTISNHPSGFGSVAFAGETISAGVYDINGGGSLTGTLILDANNVSDAIFVFRFAGAFTVTANAKMILTNGAKRCNVFFIGGANVITGAISIGASAILKGTFLSHNGACGSGDNVFIAGRQLSTKGAVVTYSGIIYNYPERITSNSAEVVLPIELLSFTGVCKNQSVVLDWSTSSEINNDSFSIERSTNAINWNVVSKVDGAGNSSSLIHYSAIDLEPYNGISYYRLKQTDFNGEFKYSAIIAIEKRGEDITELAIYPNPTNGILNVSYAGDKSQIISVSIYNVLGENVYYSEFYQSKIVFENKLNGIYFLNIKTNSKNINKKFLAIF
jgi:hypothetical protein